MGKPTPETRPISQLRPEGEGSSLLSLDMSGSLLLPLYTRPGQYAQLTIPGGPAGYFALANAPGVPPDTFEFLIKEGGAAANELLRLAPSALLEVGPPAGNGFPLETARGQDLLLLTMGSGISTLRSVIQAIVAERGNFGDVTLLHGDRSLARMPFFSEHRLWEEAKIHIRPILSREPGRFTGYAQDHLSDLPLERAFVFLSGNKEMVTKTRLALAERKLAPERVFTNF